MSLLGHRRLTGKQIFYAVDHDFPEIFYAFLMILRKKKQLKVTKNIMFTQNTGLSKSEAIFRLLDQKLFWCIFKFKLTSADI